MLISHLGLDSWAFFVSNLWTNSLFIAQACPWSARVQNRDRVKTLPSRSVRVDSVVSRSAASMLPDSSRGACVRQRRCAVQCGSTRNRGADPRWGAHAMCARGVERPQHAPASGKDCMSCLHAATLKKGQKATRTLFTNARFSGGMGTPGLRQPRSSWGTFSCGCCSALPAATASVARLGAQ